MAGTSASGTTFDGLSRAAHRLGFPNTLQRLDTAGLNRLATPLIAWVDGGHFVTVVPHSSDSVLVLDPQAGPYRIALARFRRFWSGEALIPMPEPPPSGRHPSSPAKE
jgi:ABC-type bacteriocin/lantibiotic exporter with double-glycine peptidase domain